MADSSTPAQPPVTVDYSIPSAVPTLKVMRIQSPQLSKTQAPSMSSPHLSSSLILPDSFGVIHIGETFTAYLGALNINPNHPVTNLSVSSSLQTPTKRWPLPSILENKAPPSNNGGSGNINFEPMHIKPLGGVDAIISTPLEEVGQHILRVDVSYGGPDPKLPPPTSSSSTSGTVDSQQSQQDSINYANPNQPSSVRQPINNNNNNSNNAANYHPRKTLRKFYRFQVSSPLYMKELTLRGGESSCFVSLAVENAAPVTESGGFTISQTEFQPFAGLVAKRIQTEHTSNTNTSTSPQNNNNNNNHINKKKSAVELFDESGRLNPGESRRYLFSVKASSEDAALRGIARGDELGKAVVTWRKAMGEAGRIASTFVCCPSSDLGTIMVERANAKFNTLSIQSKNSTTTKEGLEPNNEFNNPQKQQQEEEDNFVVHGSGLSVDVAASAAERSAVSHAPSEISSVQTLDTIFPITVEPIDPPNKMIIGQPVKVQLLIVNHGAKVQSLQLQMRLPLMKGIVICGQSYQNIGDVAPEGGSEVVSVTLMAMAPGLFSVNGCFVVNLSSGMEVKQPSLFHVFVDSHNKNGDVSEETKV